MPRFQTFGKQKETRTQIADLPEIAVGLSEREMRIVSGGLALNLACNAASSAIVSGLMAKTTVATGQDWDTVYNDSEFPTRMAL